MTVGELRNILHHICENGGSALDILLDVDGEARSLTFVAELATRFSPATDLVLANIDYKIGVGGKYSRAWVICGGVIHNAVRPEPTPDATWKQGLV
jgi:hypothetical protein